MKYYTDTIPLPLAEKLKEKGMPITYSKHPHQIAPGVRGIVVGNFEEIDCPNYAEVFDWLIEKGIITSIYPFITEIRMIAYKLIIKTVRNNKVTTHCTNVYSTWHEAANAAIEKALELI